MQFTEKQLEQFKLIFKTTTGGELSHEEATDLALKAVWLFKPILIPLIHEFLNDTDFLNDPNY